DDVLSSGYAEAFKFISWALLGIALRDSWSKISRGWEYIVFIGVAIMYMTMAGLYIFSPDQLCNNYLIVDKEHLVGVISLLHFVFCYISFRIYLLIKMHTKKVDDDLLCNCLITKTGILILGEFFHGVKINDIRT